MRFISLLFLIFLCGCSSLHMPPTMETEVSSFEPKQPIQVALVLGGGGSKGLAHLGVIRELEAAGIRPDLIVGCSAGAIVGALYADEPDSMELEKTLLSLKKSDLLDTSFFKFRFGVVEGKALEKFMEKTLRSKIFDELKIPLIVVATDLYTGEPVELSEKEIPIAVRASCSFPGIFKPVLLRGRYLIDGGAACPLPVEIAKKYGAKIIIAIDVTEKLPTSKPYHLFGVAKRSIEIGYRQLVAQSLAKADIAIQMDFQDIGIFSDHMNQQMYEAGRLKAQNKMAEIKAHVQNPH